MQRQFSLSEVRELRGLAKLRASMLGSFRLVRALWLGLGLAASLVAACSESDEKFRNAAAAACDDAKKNGDETDLDCGGSCSPCEKGAHCVDDSDCANGSCQKSACLSVHCTNGKSDSGESDEDCGGDECLPCATGRACDSDSDCSTASCRRGECAETSCFDEALNGNESDVDCGGSDCDACELGLGCGEDSDCITRVCTSGECALDACDDGKAGADESDVDCGGSCEPCAAGARCIAASDCESHHCAGDRCQPSECGDEVHNGTETDTDCGGEDCQPCPAGAICKATTDCASGVCEDDECQQPDCEDGVLNGSETDDDCGGLCDPCQISEQCKLGTDCISKACSDDGRCLEPTCFDRVTNGTETDPDCGGSDCEPCASGRRCLVNQDCAEPLLYCEPEERICVSVQCSDGAQNGLETDQDCGGEDCSACEPGYACIEARDCDSLNCDQHVCQRSTCFDGIQNQGEGGVDCGGSSGCGNCSVGSRCSSEIDCESLVCSGAPKTCQPSTCEDSVRNASESDSDCGGGTCDPCEAGKRCAVPVDCISVNCVQRRCVAESCDDEILNQGEGDVDCGGPCTECDSGRTCSMDSQCASKVCEERICQAPTCSDATANGDESGVDCGGESSCPLCGSGQRCHVPSDCDEGLLCDSELCIHPACADSIQQSDETDVDCGGACLAEGKACADGMHCLVAEDCGNAVCVDEICQEPTCDDQAHNGGETGIDCGGAECPPCQAGQPCEAAVDCDSLICLDDGLCAVATCLDGVANLGESSLAGPDYDTDCGGSCEACVGGRLCAQHEDCASQRCSDSYCAPEVLVDFFGGGAAASNNRTVDVSIRLRNNSAAIINPRAYVLRYFFTNEPAWDNIDMFQGPEGSCTWGDATLSCDDAWNCYVELRLSQATVALQPDELTQACYFYLDSFGANFLENNDYSWGEQESFEDLANPWSRIAVFREGQLVAGQSPP